MDVSKRNTALDITRITAMLSVIGIHFFLNSGFYDEPVMGISMMLLTILRTAFTMCVPLFILLSGYLLNKKTLSAKYYKGISKTLGVYVLASLACIFYKAIRSGTKLSLHAVIFDILDFSGANYSWYIEMYIGLFLLIPFLNIMYHGTGSQRNKTILIFTLIGISSLPSLVNIYNFSTEGWWKAPCLSDSYQALLPDWWISIYPITYYMIGAYLKEYPIQLKKRYNLLLIIAAIGIFGLFNFYRSRGGYFYWGSYTDWYGLPTLIISVLAFAFLSSRDTSRFPAGLKKFLAHISDLCLGAYLVSYIFDNVLYGILWKTAKTFSERIPYVIPMILSVAVLSLILSFIINLIYKGIEALCKKVCSSRRKEQKEKELVNTH